MVPTARFELTASKLGILRSILLSYEGIQITENRKRTTDNGMVKFLMFFNKGVNFFKFCKFILKNPLKNFANAKLPTPKPPPQGRGLFHAFLIKSVNFLQITKFQYSQ